MFCSLEWRDTTQFIIQQNQRGAAKAMSKNTIESHDANRLALTIDWEVYATMLDESDWDEAQKRELIETLWAIVVTFVDLGFAVRSAESCGEVGTEDEADIAGMVSSSLTAQALQREGAAPRTEAHVTKAGAESDTP